MGIAAFLIWKKGLGRPDAILDSIRSQDLEFKFFSDSFQVNKICDAGLELNNLRCRP
jgi:hypothetical protein